MRLRYEIKLFVLVGLLAGMLSVSACADDWTWPADMSIAGFALSQIGGNVGVDGSGTATANILIPGVGQKPIKLIRSSSGDITGNLELNTRLSGAELDGSFILGSGGLKGKGAIRCTPKSVNDATIAFASDGKATGNGRVTLGCINVAAAFAVSESSFGLNGSAPTKAHADSPLAGYDFAGTLELSVNDGKMLVTAKGTVKRTGKITNEVTQESVSPISVDPVDGQGKVNVKGVLVTFSFFGS
ncbi:MAG: hypothetical protein NT018_11510 [Armatimonadetes bacterium]|nr:hypothetical protein [Armatimonadota bacterium]